MKGNAIGVQKKAMDGAGVVKEQKSYVLSEKERRLLQTVREILDPASGGEIDSRVRQLLFDSVSAVLDPEVRLQD